MSTLKRVEDDNEMLRGSLQAQISFISENSGIPMKDIYEVLKLQGVYIHSRLKRGLRTHIYHVGSIFMGFRKGRLLNQGGFAHLKGAIGKSPDQMKKETPDMAVFRFHPSLVLRGAVKPHQAELVAMFKPKHQAKVYKGQFRNGKHSER